MTIYRQKDVSEFVEETMRYMPDTFEANHELNTETAAEIKETQSTNIKKFQYSAKMGRYDWELHVANSGRAIKIGHWTKMNAAHSVVAAKAEHLPNDGKDVDGDGVKDYTYLSASVIQDAFNASEMSLFIDSILEKFQAGLPKLYSKISEARRTDASLTEIQAILTRAKEENKPELIRNIFNKLYDQDKLMQIAPNLLGLDQIHFEYLSQILHLIENGAVDKHGTAFFLRPETQVAIEKIVKKDAYYDWQPKFPTDDISKMHTLMERESAKMLQRVLAGRANNTKISGIEPRDFDEELDDNQLEKLFRTTNTIFILLRKEDPKIIIIDQTTGEPITGITQDETDKDKVLGEPGGGPITIAGMPLEGSNEDGEYTEIVQFNAFMRTVKEGHNHYKEWFEEANKDRLPTLVGELGVRNVVGSSSYTITSVEADYEHLLLGKAMDQKGNPVKLVGVDPDMEDADGTPYLSIIRFVKYLRNKDLFTFVNTKLVEKLEIGEIFINETTGERIARFKTDPEIMDKVLDQDGYPVHIKGLAQNGRNGEDYTRIKDLNEYLNFNSYHPEYKQAQGKLDTLLVLAETTHPELKEKLVNRNNGGEDYIITSTHGNPNDPAKRKQVYDQRGNPVKPPVLADFDEAKMEIEENAIIIRTYDDYLTALLDEVMDKNNQDIILDLIDALGDAFVSIMEETDRLEKQIIHVDVAETSLADDDDKRYLLDIVRYGHKHRSPDDEISFFGISDLLVWPGTKGLTPEEKAEDRPGMQINGGLAAKRWITIIDEYEKGAIALFGSTDDMATIAHASERRGIEADLSGNSLPYDKVIELMELGIIDPLWEPSHMDVDLTEMNFRGSQAEVGKSAAELRADREEVKDILLGTFVPYLKKYSESGHSDRAQAIYDDIMGQEIPYYRYLAAKVVSDILLEKKGPTDELYLKLQPIITAYLEEEKRIHIAAERLIDPSYEYTEPTETDPGITPPPAPTVKRTNVPATAGGNVTLGASSTTITKDAATFEIPYSGNADGVKIFYSRPGTDGVTHTPFTIESTTADTMTVNAGPVSPYVMSFLLWVIDSTGPKDFTVTVEAADSGPPSGLKPK